MISIIISLFIILNCTSYLKTIFVYLLIATKVLILYFFTPFCFYISNPILIIFIILIFLLHILSNIVRYPHKVNVSHSLWLRITLSKFLCKCITSLIIIMLWHYSSTLQIYLKLRLWRIKSFCKFILLLWWPKLMSL